MQIDHVEPPALDGRFVALLAFLRSESAGGLALIGAAAVALAWSNSAWAPAYARMLALPLGGWGLRLPLDLWVNDGLMAVFFLAVGLEIRGEMAEGPLASWRGVAAPGVAALGGMVVPALIYVAFNRADPTALRGWAVPVATDIAFALAALSVLGRRVPLELKVFLTALAILDDLGAIGVIALFYTARLDWVALGAAVVVWGGLYLLRRAGVRALSPYVVGGVVLWGCVLRSGLHPTLAGVALAFVVPMGDDGAGASPAHRLEHLLGGWVTWLVLPLFGLANAGLRFTGLGLGTVGSTVALGTAVALVVGKQMGVFGATLGAVRLGLARMPAGVSLAQLYGGAVLCGIGFTMSLFIGDLGFRGTGLEGAMKLGVFGGWVVAAMVGLGVLAVSSRK